MNRRDFARALAYAGLAAYLPRAAAQGDRPVNVVVGFAAGGSVDVATRLIMQHLAKRTGRTYVVENRAGAAGRLAPEYVQRMEPDGNTLMVVPHGPMTLFPHLYRSLRFDPARDFTPLARLVTYDYALIASNEVKAANADQLRAWARHAGNAANYGSPGSGSVPHFVGAALARALGIGLTHVPYRGAAPALADVMGKQLALMVAPTADALQQQRQGKLRIIATSGTERSPVSPELPTFREVGIDYALPGWFGLYGPAGMRPDTVAPLEAGAREALASPELRAALHRMGLVSAHATAAELQKLQAAERIAWKPVVQASGFTPEA